MTNSNSQFCLQLQGEEEVLHTARVRHDWYGGGKLDLSVRQDEKVEILRVKNNPGGKWLARSLTGNCECGVAKSSSRTAYRHIYIVCLHLQHQMCQERRLNSVKYIQLSPIHKKNDRLRSHWRRYLCVYIIVCINIDPSTGA